MTDVQNPCQICSAAEAKYACPKCNIPYCSVKCYKEQVHARCSEEFYKSCIKEELAFTKPNNKESVNQMKEILERMKHFDEDFDPKDFDDASKLDEDKTEPLDSDDDPDPDEVADLQERLEGVDIDDADALWKVLTEEERKEFLDMTENGGIMKLIPKYKAWWLTRPNSKIVDLSNKKEDDGSAIPEIMENIAKYSSLCKKEPSSFLHYNLWNVITAYTAVVRYLNGEHHRNSYEAMAQLVNLSTALKYDTNFESVEDAINSVNVEAKTSLQHASGAEASVVESITKLQDDARMIMGKLNYKLAALSDIVALAKKARERVKNATTEETAMQKLCALATGCEVLTKQRLDKYLKKFEFFLSYVNRENEQSL